MERIETEVRGHGALFSVLSILSILLFVGPLLLRPPQFALAIVGVCLAFVSIVTYWFGPKEKMVIAEIDGSTLRFRSMKDPIMGLGAPYQPNFTEFPLARVTRIGASFKIRSFGGADNYVRLRIYLGAEYEEVFADCAYLEALEKFLRALLARFPNVSIEINW